MPLSDERLAQIVVENLTPDEQQGGVAYVAMNRMAAGSSLHAPGTSIEAPSEALIAFIDGAPLANWGHPARYLLVEAQTGDVRSFAARFPPPRNDPAFRWRVAYRAPSVPDAALSLLHSDR